MSINSGASAKRIRFPNGSVIWVVGCSINGDASAGTVAMNYTFADNPSAYRWTLIDAYIQTNEATAASYACLDVDSNLFEYTENGSGITQKVTLWSTPALSSWVTDPNSGYATPLRTQIPDRPTELGKALTASPAFLLIYTTNTNTKTYWMNTRWLAEPA